MSSREQRARAIVDQVDDATARLLPGQLVNLASNVDKSVATLSSETSQILACSLTIERAVEDLLVVSRTLKESWVLGQIKESKPEISEEELQTRAELVEKLVGTLRSTMDSL